MPRSKPAPELTYAIGDIHGHADKLTTLLDRCRNDSRGRSFRIVCLGDYVDRGPSSRSVIEILVQAAAEMQVICLKGNHEDMLLAAAASDAHPLELEHFLANGGVETLRSYDVVHPQRIPPRHLGWLRNLECSYSTSDQMFVHAGIRPGVPLAEQLERDLLWIREPFLSSRADHGAYIIHGHTPMESGHPDIRDNRLNLDTGAAYGGPLTAAIFSGQQREPVAFISV